MPVRAPARPQTHRRSGRRSRRRLLVEPLEDRRLLAVSFEFNYLGGNNVGFNDPVTGGEFRTALDNAASRLGGWLLHDATIQLNISSFAFNGTAVAHAFSAVPPSPPEGGFVDNVVTAKVLGQGDTNGPSADGALEVFFFDANDPFTYVTDPSQQINDNELDFQALIIHELAHTLGFTSATNQDGSDDSGNGLTTPGTWRTFDRFLSDAAGNRLIDADPQSPTAFQMNTGANGWPVHSVGGKGPNAGLFYDGPIAHAVYGAPVPLYSPATFSLVSSVAHLDSEGALNNDPVFSPLTHLMSHAIIDLPVPQEFTLVEKAIFADMGVMFIEDTLPIITAPQDITLEGNTSGGFTGTNSTLDNFLAGAVASDLFDANVTISHDAPALLSLGENTIVFTATDASGNQSTASAIVRVTDTMPPIIDVAPTVTTFEATYPGGVTGVTLPFIATVTDVVDPNPTLTFNPGSDFPLGRTTVAYTAEDSSGNVSTFPVDIVVQDTTAPDFVFPSAVSIPANVPSGANLSNALLRDLFASFASDLVDQSLTFSASPETFPVGTTTVTFTATDDHGNATDAVTELTVTAATFTVTTLTDELDADPGADPSHLSLREAISLANVSEGSDQIVFEPNLNGLIALDSALGQLQITESVSINGPGRDVITVDAQGNSRVIDITSSSGDVVLQGMTITGGSLSGDNESGAGIQFSSDGELVINDIAVSGNVTTGVASSGGGIHSAVGHLSLTDTLVSTNSTSGASSGGGGLWVGSGGLTLLRSEVSANETSGDQSPGGGLLVLDGMAIVTQSTIAGNHTEGLQSNGGGFSLRDGAAQIRDSTISGNSTRGGDSTGGGVNALASPLELTNSTVSGNRTEVATSDGGGVYASGSTFQIRNSTITANQSAGEGGGVGMATLNTALSISHSIIAGNVDDGTAPDFVGSGSIASAVRFSLIGDNTGTTLAESQTADPTTGNLVGNSSGGGLLDPLFAALADNGGPTLTHRLDGASPAIDGGDPQFNLGLFTPPLSNDQRGEGFARISGSRIDIGALESTGSVTISWDFPEDIAFGTLLDSTQLNATANAPGTFVYTPAAGTRLSTGDAQPLHVQFTPDDTGSFDVTTATVFINVVRADPVIIWNDPSSIVFGTPLSATQLNATTTIDGSFVYSTPIGTVLEAGDDQVLTVTFTPTDTLNFNTTTASVLIDVLPTTPVISWDNPQPITFGTHLGAAQLNATANIAGSFTYSPPAGVLLTAGSGQTLSVTFTPDDTRNFSSANQTVNIDVLKADPLIIWENPGDIVVGTPLSSDQLNATTRELGTFNYDPIAGTVLGLGNGQQLSTRFTPSDTTNLNTVTVTVMINVIDAQDYGDAPSEYPVTLAENGARHTTTSLLLGTTVDSELDGQPSPLADGDGPDDDGVLKIADLVTVAGRDTTSSVSVFTSAAGKLDAWIDFNQDGDWNDAGEQIVVSADVSGGDNTISYIVPDGAISGETAARFRLSSAGSLAPTGGANDGEVEDYLFTLQNGNSNSAVSVGVVDRQVTLSLRAGDIVAQSGGSELFAAPENSIGVLNIQGSLLNDTVTLEAIGATGLPAGGLNLQGSGGENVLVLKGESYDFTDVSFEVNQFSNLDLTGVEVSTVTIDAAAVSRMSPSSKSLLIRAGLNDRVDFADAADWLMSDPISINGRFIRTAINNSGGNESVGFEAPNHWQNFIRTSDINNDGELTARDALRVINELARRDFSDSVTQFLRDAITVTPWPGAYFDHNGDGRATALDALRVINDLARQSGAGSQGEAESIQVAALNVRPTGDDDRPIPAVGIVQAINHSSKATDNEIAGPAAQRANSLVILPDVLHDTDSSVSNVDALLADNAFVDQLLG